MVPQPSGVRAEWLRRLRLAVVLMLGGCAGMSAIGLGVVAGVPLLIAPFGSTCMMVFGAPRAAFAQPRNVFGGHLICTATALGFVQIHLDRLWAVPFAAGLAMGLMSLADSFHPPAGGDTILVFLIHPGWVFLFMPILLGCLILVLTAVLFHNVRERGTYPYPAGRWLSVRSRKVDTAPPRSEVG